MPLQSLVLVCVSRKLVVFFPEPRSGGRIELRAAAASRIRTQK